MKKIGFVSKIYPEYTFEQIMDTASKLGYDSVEMAAWPKMKEEEKQFWINRYPDTPLSLLYCFTGVCHLDVDSLTEEKIAYIKEYEKKTGVTIHALSWYANPLEDDEKLREKHVAHMKKLIVAANKLGIEIVSIFIGRDQYKNEEENLQMAIEMWTPLVKMAEEYNVKICNENCPMIFTYEQWPGGQNIMHSPKTWKRMFEAIDSPNFGLTYDPSHMGWQHMDYIKPIYDFKDKIYYVHFKDARVDQRKLDEVGIMAPPLEYYIPVLPGFGDIDWGRFVSALNEVGFTGQGSVEIEDEYYTGSDEAVEDSLKISLAHMRQFIK